MVDYYSQGVTLSAFDLVCESPRSVEEGLVAQFVTLFLAFCSSGFNVKIRRSRTIPCCPLEEHDFLSQQLS